jgi:hypothetical protein
MSVPISVEAPRLTFSNITDERQARSFRQTTQKNYNNINSANFDRLTALRTMQYVKIV